MSNILIILMAVKILCLLVAITFSFVNVGKVVYNQSVNSKNIWLWGIALTGFLVIQFELYLP
jgi:hypothetical protein